MLLTIVLRQHHSSLFFFKDTATPEIYTLSLHDALPIWPQARPRRRQRDRDRDRPRRRPQESEEHTSELQSVEISYAVFCLKKKKKNVSFPYSELPDNISRLPSLPVIH